MRERAIHFGLYPRPPIGLLMIWLEDERERERGGFSGQNERETIGFFLESYFVLIFFVFCYLISYYY